MKTNDLKNEIEHHAYAFGYLRSAMRGLSSKLRDEKLITRDSVVDVNRLIEEEILETYKAEREFAATGFKQVFECLYA